MAKYVQSSIGTPGIGLRDVAQADQTTIRSIYLEVFCVVFGAFVLSFILGQQWKALQERKLAKQAPKPMPAGEPISEIA